MTGLLLAGSIAGVVAQFAGTPGSVDSTASSPAIMATVEQPPAEAPSLRPVAGYSPGGGSSFPAPTNALMPAFDITTGSAAQRWDASLTAPDAEQVHSVEDRDEDSPLVRAIPAKDYGFGTLVEHTASIPLQAGGVFAFITLLGVTNWDWGSASFHFHSEGWFGKDTSSMGLDKFGHAYSTYLITEYLTSSIRQHAKRPAGNAISAGILAMGLMTYVEIFDGISKEHGFSWEDMVADTAGMAFSVLRSHVPGMKDKLDFRLHYIPSGNTTGFHPITDYSGQRYILALQLGGFSGLRDTPLRYVELQGGYMARGFTAEEKADGEKLRRDLFVGIGVNLQELLFPRPKKRWQRWGREILDYVQVPYTAIYSDQLSKD
jgi:hypothetical protein